MSANAINFKDTDFATVHGLDTALEMEKEKYAKCPVKQDYVPEHEMAQAWGYVVAAYFLMEESLKLLLHTRGATPGKTHTLSGLFGLLPCPDKDVLREYYRDFRCAFENAKTFPFEASAFSRGRKPLETATPPPEPRRRRQSSLVFDRKQARARPAQSVP